MGSARSVSSIIPDFVDRMDFGFASFDPTTWSSLASAFAVLALGAAFGAVPVHGLLLAWQPVRRSARPVRAMHRSSSFPVAAVAAAPVAAKPPEADAARATQPTSVPVVAEQPAAALCAVHRPSARIIPFPLARRVAGAYAIATAGGASPGPSFS
jgi:hypothetical protein